MQRRRFLRLTALSTASVASSALAGCTGAGAGAGGDGNTTTTDDSGDHPTTTTPGCPDVMDVSDVYCPGDDGPVAVMRSATSIPADDGTLTITVENTSGGTLGLNPYAWGVYRLTDDGHWDRVDDDRAHIEPWQLLEPGDTRSWQVASDADQKSTGDAIGCALDLDPGDYGWAVELKPESTDQRFAAGAGFFVE